MTIAAPSCLNKAPHLKYDPLKESETFGAVSLFAEGVQEDKSRGAANLHDRYVAMARQRHRLPDTTPSNQAPAPDEVVAPPDSSISGKRPLHHSPKELKGSEEPLLLCIARDCRGLFEVVLSLPRKLYPIWKWLLLVYVLWLVLSYMLASLYSLTKTISATLCPIPISEPRMPFCPSEPPKPVDVSKMATSQEELTVVMDRVGHNFDLARDIVGHEFAVRDLRIRVAASNLQRKQELVRELESLIRYTRQTAKDLSRFTAKVSKSIDTIRTFDEYAMKTLEGIANRQQNPPMLLERVMSVISPLAAFDLVRADQSEEEVKDIVITTASRISEKVKLLSDESFDLFHSLDIIQETLDRTKEIAIDELGDLPRMGVLPALWILLAHPDDHEELKSHKVLLEDITKFYEGSSSVMEETTAALMRIEAELTEFRDDFATPGLTMKDYPLEVIVTLFRLSRQRLEAGKRKLEHIEQGSRPKGSDIPTATTRTATAN